MNGIRPMPNTRVVADLNQSARPSDRVTYESIDAKEAARDRLRSRRGLVRYASALVAPLASIALLIGASGCASLAGRDASAVERSAADTSIADPAAEVAAWMAGHYDSRDQAAADPTYFPIALSMVPIWTERRDGHWLYVEQAMADTPEKPYRQRVYRVSAGADGEVLSAVFTIEQPTRFVQGWRNGALDSLTQAMLQPREGCTVALRRAPDGWRGATRGTACASDLRGAAYATAEVTLDATQMRSWDRGYAADGKQVWGANAGPYVFVKRKPAR